MRLIVLGATGGTGRALVRQALDAGHEVTALVRDREKLDLEHERLRVATGDVREAEAIDAAVAGHDAAAYCVGPAKGDGGNPAPAEGTVNLLAALERHGVRRLVLVTGWGVAESAELTPFFFRRILLPLLFAKPFGVKARQEEAVRASGLDWTIVRPMQLADGPARGYRVSLDGKGVGRKIAREDLAAFMLSELEASEHVHEAPCVGG